MSQFDHHIQKRGLVKRHDPVRSKTVYRAGSKLAVDPIDEIDDKISDFLNRKREEASLTREDVALMLGLSPQVYGRHEKRLSVLKVSRLVHLVEILGPGMLEALPIAAPQLFGATKEESDERAELFKMIMALPPENLHEIVAVTRNLTRLLEAQHLQQGEAGLKDLARVIEQKGMSQDDVLKLVTQHQAKRPRGRPRTKPAKT